MLFWDEEGVEGWKSNYYLFGVEGGGKDGSLIHIFLDSGRGGEGEVS